MIVLLLAQAQVGPVNPSWFEQYGVLAIPMAILTGLCWALFQRYEKSLDLERQEKKELRDELRELNKRSQELMIPALTQSTAAVNEAATAVSEVMRILRKEHPS